MKKPILSFLMAALAAFSSIVCAQQLVSTSGGYYQNETLSLSWSLGEPVTETFTGNGVTLTQGFQQPYNFYLQQVINIPAGWSGISSWLDPMNKGVEGIFAPWLNDLVILQSMTGIYWPATGTNTLGNWDYHTGYKIKAENEFNLSLTGTKTPGVVNLAEGWNLLPVLSVCEVPVETVFAGFEPLIIVKQVAGPYVYWPAYNINTLQNLLPGKAYFVASGEAGTVSFPACSKLSTSSGLPENPTFFTPWNAKHFSSSSHVIAFPANVLSPSGLKSGDVIGVFTSDGINAGQVQVQAMNANLALVAYANDEFSLEKEGFEAGEMFQFKVFRPDENLEMPLNVEFEPSMPNQRLFAENGLSAVKNATVGLPDLENPTDIAVEIYPNPSHGVFSLTMNYWPENLNIQLMDINGQLMREFEPENFITGGACQFNLSDLPKGVYFIRLTAAGFVGMKKIVVN